MDLKIGDCVKIIEGPNWLSKYAPLAKSGRCGTVTGFSDHGGVNVIFDVIKPGAKAINGTFRQENVAPTKRKTQPIQKDLL